MNKAVFSIKVFISIVTFFITIGSFSQTITIFSEEYKKIINARNLNEEGKSDLALEQLKEIRLELINKNNFHDSGIFGIYRKAVEVEGDIYEELNDYKTLSEFQFNEADRFKSLIKTSDEIADFYFITKYFAAYNFVQGNDDSYLSQKESLQKLTYLLNEVNSSYFRDLERKIELRETITRAYFDRKLAFINKIGEENGRSLESLNQMRTRLNGLLGEIKMRNYNYFSDKETVLKSIKSSIESNENGINSTEIQEGKYQSFLKDFNNSTPDYATERNIEYYKSEYYKNVSLLSTGMYHTLITRLKKLVLQLNNSGVSENESAGFKKLNYEIYLTMYNTYLLLQDYDNALKSLTESYIFYQDMSNDERGDDSYVSFNNNFVLLYLMKKDLKKALTYSLKAVEEKNEISKFQNGILASIYYEMEDYEKSIEWNKKYIQILKNTKSFDTSITLSTVYLQLASTYMAAGKYNDAEIYLEQARTSILEQKIEVFKAHYFAELGMLNSKKGLFDLADKYMVNFAKIHELSYFEFLLSTTEDQRGQFIKEEKYNPNLLFYFISQRKDNSNEVVGYGYNYAILSKQLLLNTAETIRKNASINEIPELDEINKKLTIVQEKLRDVEVVNRDSLSDYARIYEKELIIRGKESILQLYENSKINWRDVQNQLKEKEAAIEFISFTPYEFENNKNEIYYGAFLLKKESSFPIFINLFEESQLNEIVNPITSKSISSQQQTKEVYIEKGNKLFNLVWKPLEEHLIDVNKIFYSPSGVLHNLSFSALPYNFENIFLSEKYNLIQMSSTKEIAEPKAVAQFKSVALFGDITYNNIKKEIPVDIKTIDTRGSEFNELEGTKREIEQINEILELNNIKSLMFTQSSASEENLINSIKLAPSIVHIGTHAFYLNKIEDEFFMTDLLGFARLKGDNNPMNRSGLALFGANYFWKYGEKIQHNNEDGILTANELSTLDMKNIELVVLSACETGLGESANNEGVFGLQRGLKMAGVKNILVSLWKVNDKVTQEYMVEFYKNLIENKLSIQEAYSTTQKNIKSKYPDPYYWAAFVLIR